MTHFLLIVAQLLCFVITVQAQIDSQATVKTKALLFNLEKHKHSSLIFGHHHTESQGIHPSGWSNNGSSQRSDVKSATGSFPGVYAYDFGIKKFHTHELAVKKAYTRGGIITISWHAANPVTGGDVKDKKGNPVVHLMPGKSGNAKWLSFLDEIASFAKNVDCPVIFRPFHENTGDWFWWGNTNCTPAEFKAAWQYTVKYLRDTKGVHNFLYAYSPAQGVYDNRYPGDDWVDIIGMDSYGKDSHFPTTFLSQVRATVNFANAHNKVAAITEFGVSDGIQNSAIANWYTTKFLEPLKNDPIAKQVAYAVTWRNGGKNHYWVPVQGDKYFTNFKKFYNAPFTKFQNNLPNMYKLGGKGDGCGVHVNGWPICCNADSDPDGDGWGWENNRSCVVADSTAKLSSSRFKNTATQTFINTYPTPFDNQVNISFYLQNSVPVTLAIFNSFGEIIYQHTYNNLSQGENNITWDISKNKQNITEGTYFYNLEIQGKFYKGKLLKKQ